MLKGVVDKQPGPPVGGNQAWDVDNVTFDPQSLVALSQISLHIEQQPR
ncbi:MAG: hypothetical protein R3C02_00145 [Planctomycetaceae bacterium]